MRTTLDDRPGALAELATACGEAGVNILGLQILPDLEQVTDELVVRAPAGLGQQEIAALLTPRPGREVVVQPCTEAALTDQPTRYVEASRAVVERPHAFPEVVARLFDAEPEPADPLSSAQDAMELTVGEVQVQVSRTAPFTAIEHARGRAMAGLVSDVLRRTRETDRVVGNTGRRLGQGLQPTYVAADRTVSAVLGDLSVGRADVGDEVEPGARALTLRVDPAFQRRGIGTRLLIDAARLAAAAGADQIVLTTRADNQTVLPLVLAAGLRGRIRMAADRLTVRIGVRALKPLAE